MPGGDPTFEREQWRQSVMANLANLLANPRDSEQLAQLSKQYGGSYLESGQPLVGENWQNVISYLQGQAAPPTPTPAPGGPVAAPTPAPGGPGSYNPATATPPSGYLPNGQPYYNTPEIGRPGLRRVNVPQTPQELEETRQRTGSPDLTSGGRTVWVYDDEVTPASAPAPTPPAPAPAAPPIIDPNKVMESLQNIGMFAQGGQVGVQPGNEAQAGNDMTLKEPAWLVGLSGKVYAMMGEAGPEKLDIEPVKKFADGGSATVAPSFNFISQTPQSVQELFTMYGQKQVPTPNRMLPWVMKLLTPSQSDQFMGGVSAAGGEPLDWLSRMKAYLPSMPRAAGRYSW